MLSTGVFPHMYGEVAAEIRTLSEPREGGVGSRSSDGGGIVGLEDLQRRQSIHSRPTLPCRIMRCTSRQIWGSILIRLQKVV